MAYHDRRVRLAAAAAVAWLLTGCGRPAAPPPSAASAPPRDALLEVEGTRLVGTDARGRVRWELRAPSVLVDRQRGVTARQPRGYLIAEDGTRVQVEAGRVTYRGGDNRVELEREVRVVAGEGRWMVAERVTYEPAEDLLVATGGVRLRWDGWTVSAGRLESEPALRRARLQGAVHVSAGGGQ